MGSEYDVTLREIVEKVLKNNEIARNSDNWLWYLVYKEMGYKLILDVNLLESMPTADSLTRIRRKIQNNEHRLEADNEVREKRQKHSIEQRGFWGKRKGEVCSGMMKNSYLMD